MTYSEAKKALKKCGCAHATGETLAAMYARMVSFHCRVDGPKGEGDTTKAIYQHLLGFATEHDVSKEAQRFINNPVTASDVAFLPLKEGI